MDDWTSGEAEKLRKAIEDSQSKDAVFQERQRLKRERGLGLWEEVKGRVAKRCADFNTDMKQDVLKVIQSPSDALEVQASVKEAKASLKAEFKNDLGPLNWKVASIPYATGTPGGKFFLQVNQEGNVGFGEIENSPVIFDADWVARHLLGALIGQVKSRL